MELCSTCNKPLDENGVCPDCGAHTQTPREESMKGKTQKWLKKLSAKRMTIGFGCLAGFAALILLVVLLINASKETDYILFQRDHEIFYYDLSEDKPQQITRKLYDHVDQPQNRDIQQRWADAHADFCTLSQDGKILFFLDRLDDSSFGISLYYRYVEKPEMDPLKISSNVSSYEVNQKATVVTYEKGEDRVLYQYRLTDGVIEKIGTEVEDWAVSEDGTKIYYLNTEGGLYVQYEEESKEKIDSDVTELTFAAEDFETVYYQKDNALYKKTRGAEKEKLVSEIDSVLRIYESGEIYYLKYEENPIPYTDYLLDDLAESDALLIEPTEPSEPSVWDYTEEWQYEAAYEQYTEDYNAYLVELEAYNAKLLRDELRTYIELEEIDLGLGQLYFYDGVESRMITDGYLETDPMIASDRAVIMIYIFNQDNYHKVTFSELVSPDGIRNVDDLAEVLQSAVNDALFAAVEPNVTIGRDLTPVELNNPPRADSESITHFHVNDSGTAIYYVDDIPAERDHGELYCIRVEENTAQKPELYDSDVFAGYLYFAADDRFVYFKDVDTASGKGDLYMSQSRVDYDVRLAFETYVAENDKIVYITDWNDEKEYGTLKVYQNGKAIKISDDVFEYGLSLGGEVVYLYDYSTTYYKGDLYVYRKGKTEKLDMDVIALMPVFSNES